MEISLNVFCLETDNQIDAQEIGLTINLDECIVKEFTFFNIDFISPVRNNDKYCNVSSGGEDFVVNQSYESVKKMIHDNKICNFN